MQAKARFVALEFVRWTAVYALYLIGRQVALGNEDAAVRHTEGLVRAERTLGVFREEQVQDAVSWSHAASSALDAYYMLGFAPVCVAALVWTAWRHRGAYLELRRRLWLALALAIPFFLIFPAAPPRLIEGLGIGDTVGLSGHDTGSFFGIRFNPYAAMPSLHVGWSLLIAASVLPLVRRRTLRIAVAVHPVAMALAVTATGNHLFLDIAVGVAVVIGARALAAMPLRVIDPRRISMPRRIPIRALVAAALTLAATLAAAASASAAFVGTTGKISYDRLQHGSFDIYSVNPDGTGKHDNIGGDVSIDDPSYSPDGRELAYAMHWVSAGKVHGELALENDDPNRNGYESITVVSRRWGVPWDPTWSPDGSRLAFVSGRDGDWEIYAVPSIRGPKVQLTRNGAPDVQPAWSPDGRRIAFVGKRRGAGDLFVMNADGTGVSRLTHSGASDSYPSWSPDGTKIAFATKPARADAELGRIELSTDDLLNAADGVPGDTIDGGGDPGDICFVDDGDTAVGCVVGPLAAGTLAAARPAAEIHGASVPPLNPYMPRTFSG